MNAVERRRGNDGKLYNARDFQDHYGKGKDGGDKWAAAKPFVERKLAQNNLAYTVGEFRAYYIDALGEQGWLDKWVNAKEETRKAADGKYYSFTEFMEYYKAEA